MYARHKFIPEILYSTYDLQSTGCARKQPVPEKHFDILVKRV